MATNPYLYPRTSAAIVTGLTPLTKLTNLDFLLAVRSSLNIRTFQELIAHVRANPGKLNLATTNTGSFQNLGAELLRQQADLDFKTIPYNGGAAAATAVAGGHVDMLIDASAVIAPLAQSGVLNIVASGLIQSGDSQIVRSSSSSHDESGNCRECHPSGSPAA